MSAYQTIIGRFEYIDVVDQVESIPAKIDTGAYRSSIHVSKIAEKVVDGVNVLEFTLLGHSGHESIKVLQTEHFRERIVRSSSGHNSQRYEVKLKIRLGYKSFQASFTLSDRSNNVFPVLIGREALKSRFLVDPSKAGVNRKRLRIALEESQYKEELEGINT